MGIIWIGYTTLYREGGEKFERVARTMEQENLSAHAGILVRREAVESKEDFLAAMQRIEQEGETISELHFIGHSGLYGIMFGTTSWPEQFSPHEWRTMHLPLASDAEIFFHACRTARWFAPFIARTFGVPVRGYHWYTTFSLRPDTFRWESRPDPSSPLYVVSCRGRKSHGVLGSAMKYVGMAPLEPMQRFEPEPPEGDTSYDAVADRYDAAFDDITVRHAEWDWLGRHLPAGNGLRLLDIGCGNGSLLTHLGDRLARGVGVDKSPRMIEIARRRADGDGRYSFEVVADPILPFETASFDVVISFMSFRYLDWDPMMNEIRRVLVPGGKILIVDMAASPIRLREMPKFTGGKLQTLVGRRRNREFTDNLHRLVSDPNWGTMLRYNPIRAEHEYRWYLASRFPGHEIEILNIGWTHKLLAFDSGNLEPGQVPEQSYP